MPKRKAVAEVPTSPKPRKVPVLVRKGRKKLNSRSSPDSDSDPGVRRSNVLVKHIRKRRLEPRKKSTPNKILLVTEAQYKRAIDFLESEDTVPLPTFVGYCNRNTLIGNTSAAKNVVSGVCMFEEMTNCLDKGDLDGFISTVTGAYSTRKKQSLLYDDFYCAALYALIYHPVAKDPEIFKRCLESLFNKNHRKLGSADTIMQLLNKSFAFESEL